jgi:YihY family inner membrane protein
LYKPLTKLTSRIKTVIEGSTEFLTEKGIGGDRWHRSRTYRFAHFCLMVAKSFSRNRCPVRAAALAYTTLLALIPMLAVALSISTGLMKKEGEDQILHLVDRFVDSFSPPEPNTTNKLSDAGTEGAQNRLGSPETNTVATVGTPPANGISAEPTNLPPVAASASNPQETGQASTEPKVVDDRRKAARTIIRFIQRTNSGTLGVMATVLLVFVAINMLGRVEETFNDIWGLARGRSWASRFVLYSALLLWAPVLMVFALGLASGPHLAATRTFIHSTFAGSLLLQALSIIILCLTFGLLYLCMPNTKVHWRAALIGGLSSGVLWHLNNVFSVFYVSRWVSNSRIYGSLAIIPVVMVGLYFGWLILLFGAQVAYAYQNRSAYLQEKQIESINQRGREFIALRLMACVGQRFQGGQSPASVLEISEQLGVPSRLAQQLLQVLVAAQLVVEVSGTEVAYVPARPLEIITCHDILLALRAGQGQELVTTDEPARAEVYGEFKQILEAERRAASAVTVLMMVNRVEASAALGAGGPKVVTDSPTAQT